MRPIDSTLKFAKCLLAEAASLQWTSARYGADGRVLKVRDAWRETHDLAGVQVLLPWLKGQNSQGEAIWCRPADPEHPWLLLDDVSTALGYRLSKKYAVLLVETSPGNGQVLLLANRALSVIERTTVRRALTQLIGADPGAISEPRWGRCPGFRSGKQGRAWTNLLTDTSAVGQRFDATSWLEVAPQTPARKPELAARAVASRRKTKGTGDESGREFAYACRSLQAGIPPGIVVERVAEHAFARGKRADYEKARRYADDLVAAALKVVA